MQRIDTPTALPNLFGVGKGGCQDGNRALGIMATILDAAWFNAVQEEIASFVELCGLTLDPANRSQLIKAVQTGKIFTAAAAGTSDAISATFTPAITSVSLGLGTLLVRAASANTTGTPTFTPGSITPAVIVKGNNLPLVAGDIAGAGHWLMLQFDSVNSNWVLLNPAKGLITAVQSLASNGYVQLPGGLIIQWGTASIAVTPTTGGETTITLPTTFTTPLRAFASQRETGGQYGGWYGPYIRSLSSTQITLGFDDIGTSASIGSAVIEFLALGY